jgi:hypothetical protein
MSIIGTVLLISLQIPEVAFFLLSGCILVDLGFLFGESLEDRVRFS